MMLEAFRPEHLRAMKVQPQQQAELQEVDDDYLAWLAAAGPCVTIRDGDTIVACGGVIDWQEGSSLWSFLGENAGRHMHAVVRAARRLIEVSRLPIMAEVDLGFGPGCRLLELLGFRHVADGLGISATGQHQHVYLMES